MKMVLSVLGVGLGMMVAGLAGPEKPVEPDVVPPGVVEKDLGLYVFPEGQELKLEELLKPGHDAMLKKLMAEMLQEAEQDQEEMEKPVELPQLDAPELRRLLRGERPAGLRPNVKRWTLGVILKGNVHDRIVVQAVMSGSPAAEAGLRPDDELTDVNGILLRDHPMLVDLLQVIRDQQVELGLQRGEEELKVKIAAEQREVPNVDFPNVVPRVAPVLPKPKVVPEKDRRDDEVLKELRGMRKLMEEMLKEMKKTAPLPKAPRTRRVPDPPEN